MTRELILKRLFEYHRKERQIPSQIKLLQVFTLFQAFISNLLGDETLKEEAAKALSHLLALPYPDGDARAFVEDLIIFTWTEQCKQEEKSLLESKADFVLKIRDGLKKEFPDLRQFTSILSGLAEYSPLMGCISYMQTHISDDLVKMRGGDPQEIRDVVISKSIVGSSINLNVFSARASKAKIMSQASSTKKFMFHWKDYLQHNIDLLRNVDDRTYPVSLTYSKH